LVALSAPHRSVSVASGVATVKIDEGSRELSLPAREFQSIRLEFVAVRLALAQPLLLCNERAQPFL
jgi:hypothetical protein